MLNAGHRRNGKVSVCGPKSAGYQPTDFRVFCPKVIAGIGKLPETIADRAIPIRLKRKGPWEKVAGFRTKLISSDTNSLKARLRSWVSSNLEDLKHADPELPDCLSDRQQDGAEPLLAIADAAGGDWPSRARAALIELFSSDNAAEESLGVSLLSDIRDIFCETNAEELSSKELVGALCKLDGLGWRAFRPCDLPGTPHILCLNVAYKPLLGNRASRVGQVGPEESDHALERKRANPRGPKPRRAGLFHQERLLARAVCNSSARVWVQP
jgi:hypothetical protein